MTNIVTNYLKKLSIWQVIILTMGLFALAGLLAGLIIGSEYQQIRIPNDLEKIAHQHINYVMLNENIYEISQITKSCYPRWIYNDIANATCTLTNTHDNTRKIYYPGNNTFKAME